MVREDTARLVADMLIGVTGPTGTAPEAAIDGYLTAGKTGTAQKANLLGTRYDPNRYVASFVGLLKNFGLRIFSMKIFGPITLTIAESAYSSNQSARAYSYGSDG